MTRDVPEQQCATRSEEQCTNIVRQVPEQVCETVTDEVCRDEAQCTTETQCQDVPRTITEQQCTTQVRALLELSFSLCECQKTNISIYLSIQEQCTETQQCTTETQSDQHQEK